MVCRCCLRRRCLKICCYLLLLNLVIMCIIAVWQPAADLEKQKEFNEVMMKHADHVAAPSTKVALHSNDSITTRAVSTASSKLTTMVVKKIISQATAAHKSTYASNKSAMAAAVVQQPSQSNSSSVSDDPCDADCVKFRQVLSSYTGTKPKAAIYYLVDTGRIYRLNTSLIALFNYFLHRFNYPVIIFHEEDLSHATRDYLRALVSFPLYFQEIEFTFPPYINSSTVSANIACTSRVSYRHMCRFQAKEVYEQPIMFGLEYAWRLDDDSYLLDHIDYDIFEWMRDHKIRYGYIKQHVDSFLCTAGLWNATRTYIKQRNMTAKFFDSWREPSMYYNNFEISDMSLWMSSQYKDFINYIDRLGGIYYHRWGDAPIKSIAVSLFVNVNETYKFANISYHHTSFYTNSTYTSF